MDNYIFRFEDKLQAATHELKHVPSDLTDYGMSYGKVKGIANIVKKHSNNLKFIKEDAEFLYSRFMDYGINNRVELTCYSKEILGQTEYFEFSCFIDFESCQFINGVFECGLYEAGFYQLFDKHYSQVYDVGSVFMDANTDPKFSYIDYYGLKRVSNLKYNYSGNISAPGGYGKPMFIIGGNIDNNDSKNKNTYDTLMFKDASGYGFQGMKGIKLEEKTPLYIQKWQEYIHTVSGTCNFRVKISNSDFRTLPSWDAPIRFKIYALVQYQESLPIYYPPFAEYLFFGAGTIIGSYLSDEIYVGHEFWGNADNDRTIEASFNFNTSINIDNLMFVAEIIGLDNNADLSYINAYANCDVDYFDVDLQVEYQNGLLQLPILNYSAIISSLLSKINSDNYFNVSLITNYLDSTILNKHLLIGGCYTVNQETNIVGYSANISLESILQALKGYFDIEMCVSVEEGNYRNVKIWFEKSGSGLSLIHDFKDNISEVSISPANDLIFSTIAVGSNVDNSTEEDIIDYTKQRTYDTGNITEKNEYSLTPQNISGSVTELEKYIKENHRLFLYNAERGISITNGTPDKFYSVHCNIKQQYNVDRIIYEIKRDYSIKVHSGMLYPEYAYNLYYTPYNLVTINMREIASLCYLSRINVLKNIGGQTENQIELLINGVVVPSDSDVVINRALAYYKPFYYEFTAPADIRLLQSYDNNRRGYFMFAYNGTSYKGIIAASTQDDADGVNIEPFRYKEANVKLLLML